MVCQLLTKHDVPNIAAAISPYREVRDEVRKMVGRFVHRIDDPYEEPLNPEVIVSTDRETVEESAGKVIRKLEEMGWLPR
jgi:adenylylsulfate kinase-like enzyme